MNVTGTEVPASGTRVSSVPRTGPTSLMPVVAASCKLFSPAVIVVPFAFVVSPPLALRPLAFQANATLATPPYSSIVRVLLLSLASAHVSVPSIKSE